MIYLITTQKIRSYLIKLKIMELFDNSLKHR
jgi:hypothetical protein